MGLPSPHTLESQGHLKEKKEEAADDREGELKMEKKVGNVKYFLLSTPWPGTCIDFCMRKISVFDKVG